MRQLNEEQEDMSAELAEILYDDEEEFPVQPAEPPPEADTSLVFDLPPGIYPGIPEVSYHVRKRGFISKHGLDYFLKSPAHYDAYCKGELDESGDKPAFRFGRAAHCAVLENHRFSDLFAVMPDFGDLRANKKTGTSKDQGKKNKDNKDAWIREHKGRTFVTTDEARALNRIAENMYKIDTLSKMLSCGMREVTIRWNDEHNETNLPCKARPDWLAPELKMAIDLKFCEDASFDAFSRDAAKYNYHIQEAIYRQACAAVGSPIDLFLFVLAEKKPPYVVEMYELSKKAKILAEQEIYGAMNEMGECLATGHWWGYTKKKIVSTVDLPKWRYWHLAGDDE